ncbi:MAG: PPC domain-containing protein [Thermoplasmatales archaeon]|nr:PPC domain-containing protein [Thermoplasmatales archaeon]
MKGKAKIAVGIVVLLAISAISFGITMQTQQSKPITKLQEKIKTTDISGNEKVEGYLLDSYIRDDSEETLLLAEGDDAGYNVDTGNEFKRALPIYPGEVRDLAPGRKFSGQLEPGRDNEDWYSFSVCEKQKIKVTLNPTSNFDLQLSKPDGSAVATSANAGNAAESIEFTADTTGLWGIRIYAGSGASAGGYTFDVKIEGQNDAGTGKDAGNSISQATKITPGTYNGYMDMNDWEDWYSFDVSAGQGIKVEISPMQKSDFDIHLYDPSGNWVYSAQYYGDDTLEYPVDKSGTWYIKIDMFPGWDKSKWPENYFLYGSGVYKLTLTVGVSASPPPGPIPQPEIIPVAQTFVVNDDPNSNKDEYAYIAAIPAANYVKDGKRYVSPIVYRGVNKQTHWFGTVDDTTQYLLDDWNTYLARHGMTATEYVLNADPVKAAAEIATTKWTSSSTAVIAVDGSEFEDEVNTVVDKDATLVVKTKQITAPKGSSKLKDLGGKQALPMFLDKSWGVMTVYTHGSDSPAVGVITPRYEPGTEEDWPHPYDARGDNTNIYFPVSVPGLWIPYVGSNSGDWTLEVTVYSGDRYTIPISTTDCSIKVTVTTDSPSYLEVFLVDPYANIRDPSVPHWNGGPINPIHTWNAGHWPGIGFEQWRRWEPTYSTEHTVEAHYPMTGKWTAIVAPHYPYGQEKTSDSIPYHIKIEIRQHNPKRVNAGLSAANAAVIASLKHAPLLYVKEDSIPTETTDALTKLGVSNIIFVNIGEVSSVSLPGSVTEYKTLKEVVDAIKKDEKSENFITITSFGTLNGYFAPAGMIAAYHGSPVLSIGEAAEAYDILDKATTWRTYGGGWYHGCRAQGHLPSMSEPFDWSDFLKDLLGGNIPSPGFDLEKRWFTAIHDGIYNLTADYGLDLPGKEAYLFVADREDDIRHLVIVAMTGNNSYAGQIIFDTPAMQTALICRDILYPAIIYANPGRDVTTSQLMNFPDGNTWRTNDGKSYSVFSSRELKKSFSSHGRFYEGHCLWENLLERYNTGASVCYYSGHGTGGSGISAQPRNWAEDFPLAEPRYEHLKDFTWWDGWRGYMYDDTQTKDPRWGGFTWYNPKEPNLYDIIHFKWVDQLFQNLHSEIDLWMSCTTGQHFGPDIYLEHGAALWYGNAGTGLCPQEDLLDDWWIHDFMVEGKPIGEALSTYIYLHQRDYTTGDDFAMYGSSSLQVTNVQVIFGDPTLICYSPEWVEPTPVAP